MKIAILLASLTFITLLTGCNNNSQDMADKEATKMDAYKAGILAKQAAARASASVVPNQKK